MREESGVLRSGAGKPLPLPFPGGRDYLEVEVEVGRLERACVNTARGQALSQQEVVL